MNLFAYVFCHKILLPQFSPGSLEHRQLSYRIHDDDHRLKSIENDARIMLDTIDLTNKLTDWLNGN